MVKKLFLFVVISIVVAPVAARADVSFLLLEAVGITGELTASGHSAIYLSNICTDDGISLRPCRDGEPGVVISCYPKFGNSANYEWMAVPLLAFMYGVESQDQIPIYANDKVRTLLREEYRRKHLDRIIPAGPAGTTPDGYWKKMLTAAFNRDVYGFTVRTTEAEDLKFLNEVNSQANVGHFGTLTNNCADFARRTLNRYFPGSAHRDWINDFGITTPKAVAHSFFNYAKDKPERELSISRFPQVPGPIRHSSATRSFTEMAFKSKKYLIMSLIFKPILVPIFAGAYTLTGRFDVHKTYLKYASRETAGLGNETKTKKAAGLMYFAGNTPVEDSADKLKRASAALVGTKEAWQGHKAAFAPILKSMIARGLFRDENEVRSFFRDLELQSEPAIDMNGQMTLKVNCYGENRILGITRLNLVGENSDAELALKLLIARIYSELNAHEKDRGAYSDFQADWQAMQQIIGENSANLASINKARGPFATTGKPAFPPQTLKKALITISH